MSKTTYKVQGMTCGGCVGSLTRALGEALGNNKIEVKLEGGLVQIEGTHDAKLVAQVVQNAGFDFAGAQ